MLQKCRINPKMYASSVKYTIKMIYIYIYIYDLGQTRYGALNST